MPDYVAQNVLIGVGMLKVDGASIGYTSGGVTLMHASDKVELEVDQSYSPIGIHKTKETFQVRSNLAEATLENLRLVWEQTEAIVVGVGVKTLSWGMNEDVVEHTLAFIGKSPEGFDRTFTVYKAVVWETGDMQHQKNAITTIPCTLKFRGALTATLSKKLREFGGRLARKIEKIPSRAREILEGVEIMHEALAFAR